MKTTPARWLLLTLVLAASVAGHAAGGSDTRLISAVKAGNIAEIRALSKRADAVNAAEADGTTALHWAVRADDLDTVTLLLGAGANAKAVNRYGVTPLSLAAENGSLGVTQALLKAGADPNTPLAEGQTILMVAARAGNAAVVNALLGRGADANVHDAVLGETPLIFAAIENHPGVIAALVKGGVKGGADLNARSTVTSFPQNRWGDGIIARSTVLPRGGWTPVMYAARQGSVAAARALAEAGANLNATDPDGSNALVLAIINLHFDLAKVLIDKGADPNVADRTGMAALYAAVDAHTLPETVGRPNPKPHDAIDSPDIIAALLAHGANPNARLTTATLDRVHNDGNSDASLGEGATPLMRAAKQMDVPVMRLLLDHGADLNLANKKGTTPLMYAAGRAPGFRGAANQAPEEEAIEATALCLERGAKINAVDDTGQTALHLAAATAGDGVIKLLAAKGADLFLKDKRGRTPLDIANGVGAGRGGGQQAAALDGGGGAGGGAPAPGRAAKVALFRQLMDAAKPKNPAVP